MYISISQSLGVYFVQFTDCRFLIGRMSEVVKVRTRKKKDDAEDSMVCKIVLELDLLLLE